jgi:mannose-1-phosphate guanylyltransferase/mannose-6-phosphate isomerase
VATAKVLPVIMSGGSGTRLWPLSTEDKPKQFHALASELSMIQDTAMRFHGDGIEFLAPVVICNRRHGQLAKDQLNALGIEPAAVILEPFGRNTAAVGVVASAWAKDNAPGALALLLPADHIIAAPDAFRDAIANAANAAEDNIVTFGIEPEGPETGYGYIQRGEKLYEGAFLFSPSVMLDEAGRYCPKVKASSIEALQKGDHTGVFIALEERAFAACPSEPIDTAVMERTEKAVVAPCDIGWADVGSWKELWRQGPRGHSENFVKGDVLLLETENSLIWSDGPTVSVIGVSDLIIIATAEHVLVLPKDRAQDVKAVVDEMKRRGAK